MKKYASHSWSFLTVFVLIGVIASIGLVVPTAARPIADEGKSLVGPERPTQARQHMDSAVSAIKRNRLVSYANPKEGLLARIARAELGPTATQAQIEAASQRYLAEYRATHFHGPDLVAASRLQRNEQRALAAGSSPAALGLEVTGTLRLFSVAVEFTGTDSVTNFSHPVSVDDRTCITETLTLQGPLHNQIPAPGPRDNFTLWRPSFEADYYEKLLFSTEGITERIRLDLIDPEDGQAGIDLSGITMRNYFEEVSGGRVDFDGGPEGVIAWLQVPHSEAYYGASACFDGEAGDIASMEGLPSNPEFGFGPSQLLKDIVDEINQADPNFPWQDYDTNGDGVIDHVVIFHAGKDKSVGGGQQSWQAMWAHRGTVGEGGYVADDKGTADLSDDVKLDAYTMQYEDIETGTLVHEFGHDLGLPDLYDTSRDGDESVAFWDLMSSGSYTGKLSSTLPPHLSAWNKFALGWTDTTSVTPTAEMDEIALGQTSILPAGTEQAVRVDLPDNRNILTELLPDSTQAWYSSADQSLADVRLMREIDLSGQTAPISISFDIDWAIEEDWDYLFAEVSVDGGATYTTTKGFEVGTNVELTTPDDYNDPNGNLDRFGGGNAYTGSSGGWVRAYHDLSEYAGEEVMFRFRYMTDEAILERGTFLDNFVVRSSTTTILDDPVEDSDINGWTTMRGSSSTPPTEGNGWVLSDGVKLSPQYYLIEWRNPTGFDKGLLYGYNTIFYEYTPDGRDEWRVDHIPSNVPGMLVWLRDTRFGVPDLFGFDAGNQILDPENQFFASPSEGPKGGLLVIDAHPEPLRGPFNSTFTNEYGTYRYPPFDNWNGNVQTSNAAFTLNHTPAITLTFGSGTTLSSTTILTPTRYAAMAGVAGFHDALGYFPGVEKLPQPITTYIDDTTRRFKPYAFKDPDAGVVVPAKSYYSPRTPAGFTGRGTEKSPPSETISTFETVYYLPNSDVLYPVSIGEAGGVDIVGQQSGNPGSTNVQYGYHFDVVDQSPSGNIGTVRLWNAMQAVSLNDSIRAGATVGAVVTVRVEAQNVGSPIPMTVYSDFDETKATYVEGSATNGAVPVRASEADVQDAFRRGGVAAVRALQVAPAQATAVVWTSPTVLDSGARGSFTYQLTRKTGQLTIRVVNRVFGPSLAQDGSVLQLGTISYMPLVFGQD